MRAPVLVALISATQPARDGSPCPRAFLRAGGQTVIAHQVSAALALGCDRVICVSHGLSAELVEVQHRVEHAGKRFHLSRGREALHGLITAADDVLVMADGVWPAISVLKEHVGTRRGVMVVPVEAGLAEGLERIDREWAWAGVVRCGGGDVERLADLPLDIDPLGALMRSALQSGRPLVRLPDNALNSPQWWLIDNAVRAGEAGRIALRARAEPAGWFAPANAAIDRLTIAHAERLLRRSGERLGIAIAGGAAFLSAIVAADYGYLSVALGGMALVAAAARAFRLLRGLRSDGAVRPAWQEREFALLPVDIGTAVAIWLATYGASWDSAMFPLLILLLGTRLAATASSPVLRAMAQERIGLCLLLAIAASLGWISPVLQLGAAALILAMIMTERNGRKS